MDERLIEDQVESIIEDASQAIKDAGLDPYYIEREGRGYRLAVPALFNYEAVIEDILSTGLSNIVTHRGFYSILFSRLNFNIELPLIQFSAGSARANGEVFSNKLDFSACGAIDVVSILVKGEVHFNFNVISGLTLRSVDIDLTLGDINSDAKMVVMGEDRSDDFNDFVGQFVPATIKEHYGEINELLELILFDINEENLRTFD